MIRKLVNFLKSRFPKLFQHIFGLRDALLNIPIQLQILKIRKSHAHLSIAYLTRNFPKPPALRNEFAHGGSVKLTYLAETFPHHFPSANLLYAVSSVGHPLRMPILAEAKRKGLKIIINQNGVAFPAWDGLKYEASNHDLKAVINFADVIVYQSRFCKVSAERYISPPNVPHEIIYNPVDISLFTPENHSKKSDNLTLLLGGNQNAQYRLELALKTLKSLHRYIPDAKLTVTGKLWQPYDKSKNWTEKVLMEMGLTEHITFTGPYVQKDAPLIYSNAHLLLHTQYADSSPGLVLEALACGLPVVYVDNGGVPELVGDAGIGVPVEHSWELINLPDPEKMADAVLRVYSRRKEFSGIARQRAVEQFSLEMFVAKHRVIFNKVLDL